ncbi:MAG TPA: RNA polymerase subunit sigma-70 [Actinomycetes bacterium]|nr:RNA polymerase subunit sigma-70 [Actinomycetes bacterium]
MSLTMLTAADQARLLRAAQAGDQPAFETLVVAAHQRALHVHCYRMLGSLDDADEATQETLLLAWRGLAGYQQRAPLRHWLYRIATTTCLKFQASRGRQPVSVAELTYLSPYPDRLLDELAATDDDPAAHAERRESVRLAFIVALQLLPATQRAVLILREVLVWSAAEVAELLDTSVAAVNSLLQRARATVRATEAGSAIAGGSGRLDRRDREVVDRFVAAWQRVDVDALAALLREDAVLRMPPERAEYVGRVPVAHFFATVPAGGRLDQIELTVTSANGQPCLAAYLTGDGMTRPYGVMVLTVAGGEIAAITGFPDPALFGRFGLSRSDSG